MKSTVVSSQADLLPAIPLAIMMKSGRLRLANDRLRFVTTDHDVVLDAPVSELHSVATAVVGLHVWHDEKRYRFALGARGAAPVKQKASKTAAGPTSRVLNDRGELDDHSGTKVLAAAWVAALAPLVGSPPSGLQVRSPWPRWAWIAALMSVSAFFIVAVIVVVRLKS